MLLAKKMSNYMHAVLAIFQFLQNGTFKPMHEIWIFLAKSILLKHYEYEGIENDNSCLFSVHKTCLCREGVQKAWKCAYIIYEWSLNEWTLFLNEAPYTSWGQHNTCDKNVRAWVSTVFTSNEWCQSRKRRITWIVGTIWDFPAK